jgi:hypothetical protein
MILCFWLNVQIHKEVYPAGWYSVFVRCAQAQHVHQICA